MSNTEADPADRYRAAGMAEEEIDALVILIASNQVAEPFASHVAVPVPALRVIVAVLDRFVDRAAGLQKFDRMSVNELLDKLDTEGNVIGVLDQDTKAARAFVLKATPPVVQLIEDLTMRADVPPPHPGDEQ